MHNEKMNAQQERAYTEPPKRDLIGNVISNMFCDLANLAESVADSTFNKTERIRFPQTNPNVATLNKTDKVMEVFPEYFSFLREHAERIRQSLKRIESVIEQIEI